jgi:hypothetical protein
VSPHGYGREAYSLPVGPRAFVDESILKLLEDGGDWATFVHLVAQERGAAGSPIRLGALMVMWNGYDFTAPTRFD